MWFEKKNVEMIITMFVSTFNYKSYQIFEILESDAIFLINVSMAITYLKVLLSKKEKSQHTFMSIILSKIFSSHTDIHEYCNHI